MNNLPPSKPGTVLSKIKGPAKLVLGTIVYYKEVLHLYSGENVQVHQEDEPQNTIDIYQTVGEIV